jgi:hypothetical protein
MRTKVILHFLILNVIPGGILYTCTNNAEEQNKEYAAEWGDMNSRHLLILTKRVDLLQNKHQHHRKGT